jgi:hypothetical protein
MIKTTSFEEKFEAQFKLSPNNAINEFRTETDPHTSYFEYRTEYVFTNNDEAAKLDDEHIAFYEWMERAEKALSEYQTTMSEKYATRNTTDELDFTPDSRPNKLSNYKAKTTISVDTSFTDGQAVTSRDIWDRTSGWDATTVVITEYGTFNPYSNSASAAAMMRMRKVIRNHVEWITMGSVNINLDDLTYYCGQHKCEFEGTLEGHGNMAEIQEYLILNILQHLGTHNPFNNLDYPFPPIKTVKQWRDEEDYKVFTHLMRCKNKQCNHGNMVLGDW